MITMDDIIREGNPTLREVAEEVFSSIKRRRYLFRKRDA